MPSSRIAIAGVGSFLHGGMSHSATAPVSNESENGSGDASEKAEKQERGVRFDRAAMSPDVFELISRLDAVSVLSVKASAVDQRVVPGRQRGF